MHAVCARTVAASLAEVSVGTLSPRFYGWWRRLCGHTQPEAAALRPCCPQLLEHSQDLFIIGEGARCLYESASVRRTLGYSLIGCVRHCEGSEGQFWPCRALSSMPKLMRMQTALAAGAES